MIYSRLASLGIQHIEWFSVVQHLEFVLHSAALYIRF